MRAVLASRSRFHITVSNFKVAPKSGQSCHPWHNAVQFSSQIWHTKYINHDFLPPMDSNGGSIDPIQSWMLKGGTDTADEF